VAVAKRAVKALAALMGSKRDRAGHAVHGGRSGTATGAWFRWWTKAKPVVVIGIVDAEVAAVEGFRQAVFGGECRPEGALAGAPALVAAIAGGRFGIVQHYLQFRGMFQWREVSFFVFG